MNKYEIIGIVGEGAYGIVYKAKCKETGEFGKSLFISKEQHDCGLDQSLYFHKICDFATVSS